MALNSWPNTATVTVDGTSTTVTMDANGTISIPFTVANGTTFDVTFDEPLTTTHTWSSTTTYDWDGWSVDDIIDYFARSMADKSIAQQLDKRKANPSA